MTGPAQAFVVRPGVGLAGDVAVPADKSISHRAALLGALAKGDTEIRNYLEGEDCLATLRALGALGVGIERPAPGRVVVHGAGERGLRAPAGPIDLGNSGTAMRLLTGVLAGQGIEAELVGDASLMQRPMERVAAPLRRMGADVRTREGTPPVVIGGGRRLTGCDHVLDVPSAQVKSALLLAGLHAEGRTSVREPAPTRDHTERLLDAFGIAVTREPGVASVTGPARLRPTRVDVPGDFSSAAFFLVAGLIAGRGPLAVRGVGLNPTRTALLRLLRRMGADIHVHERAAAGPEPVGDIEVRPARLRGIQVTAEEVPHAIDELPVLLAAAAVAEGETIVSGAGELRLKESDRLAAMADGLDALGIEVEATADGLRVRGGRVVGGTVEARGDHRIAMAFAVLGACAERPLVVRDVQNVATSFPGFAATARAAGLALEETA